MDFATGQVDLLGKEEDEETSTVAFLPDGKQIATFNVSTRVKLWDSATGAANGEFGRVDGCYRASLVISPNGKQIAVPVRGAIVLLEVSTRREHCTIGFGNNALALAFHQMETRLRLHILTIKSGYGTSARGVLYTTFQGYSDKVLAVNFSPNGKQIASVSNDRTVRLWDCNRAAAYATLKGRSDTVSAVAYSPVGTLIASSSYDNTVRLWDSVTGAMYGIFEGHSDRVLAVAFSPDGKQIASASADTTVRLWSSDTGATPTEATSVCIKKKKRKKRSCFVLFDNRLL